MPEVATAARQDGAARRDSDRIDESFRLACEALAVGVTCSSEHIIDRAQRFRRGYSGPATRPAAPRRRIPPPRPAHAGLPHAHEPRLPSEKPGH
jgi:hypothetical protein